MFKSIFSNRHTNKKKDFSTPAILGALMLIGMLIIFTFESLGLSKRDFNLNNRRNGHKINVEDKIMKITQNKQIEGDKTNNFSVTSQLERSKEEKLKLMIDILVDGVYSQTQYEEIMLMH
jgi:hypothetical protein